MLVYVGYLTNTGIKFMILVENIYLNPEDGTRYRQDQSNGSSSSSSSSALLPSLSVSDSGSVGSRETDLKNIFVSFAGLFLDQHAISLNTDLLSLIAYTITVFSYNRPSFMNYMYDIQ
jgi:hypothetical protein